MLLALALVRYAAPLCSVCLSRYLLEKSRVVSQAAQERGYHIFYEMIRGLSNQQKETCKLTKPLKYYKYLNPPGITPTYDITEEKVEDDAYQSKVCIFAERCSTQRTFEEVSD